MIYFYFLCDCIRKNKQSKRARTLDGECSRVAHALLCWPTVSEVDVDAMTIEVFPPISCYVLLPCDRWQQWGTLTEVHRTWKCGWNRGVSLNSSGGQKWHLLTFIAVLCTFLEIKQLMWAKWGSLRCFSILIKEMWKTCVFQTAIHNFHLF